MTYLHKRLLLGSSQTLLSIRSKVFHFGQCTSRCVHRFCSDKDLYIFLYPRNQLDMFSFPHNLNF